MSLLRDKPISEPTTAISPLVEITGLRFNYPDGHEALSGVDLALEPGEKVALLGPNGAGKSTLLLHLNGIHLATAGEVKVAGQVVTRKSAKQIRAQVGLVFQDPDDQLFSPTVFEDVAFGPLYMGLPEDIIRARVADALATVGMAGLEDRPPYRLSIGQRKRVALATVLAMEPKMLVLDEPSAGLDPRGRRELIELLSSMPHTLFASTHDMRLAADVFPRAVIMDGGRVVADGPTDDLLHDEDLLLAHGLELP